MPRVQRHKRTDSALIKKLQLAYELLNAAKKELGEASAMKDAAAAPTFAAINRAWRAVDKATACIDDVRHDG